MFYIAYAYGKMMKDVALFYLHDAIHVLANFSL
jgi:predicted peroxiredoxin